MRNVCWKSDFEQNRKIEKCNRFLDSLSLEYVSQATLKQYWEFSDSIDFLLFPQCSLFLLSKEWLNTEVLWPKPSPRWNLVCFVRDSPSFWCSGAAAESTSGKTQGWGWWIFGYKEEKLEKFYVESYHTVHTEAYAAFSGEFYCDYNELAGKINGKWKIWCRSHCFL